MDNIVIKEYNQYNAQELLPLYQSVGWNTYFNHPEQLKQAFDHSLYILGAFSQQRLVGLLRAVGDSVSVILIQDILVRPEYQRQGIGTKLMARLFSCCRNVRQIHVITDDQPGTVGFYTAVGFVPIAKCHYRALTKHRYS